MGIHDLAQSVTDQEALAQAAQVFPHTQAELLTQSPWAKTYRLRRDGGLSSYLKILPARHAAVLTPYARLAAAFPNAIPPLLAANAAQGWMLSRAHGGTTLTYEASEDDLQAVLRTYAQLQAQIAPQAELLADWPRIDIDSLPQRLLKFLQTDETSAAAGLNTAAASQDADVALVNAAYFLGEEEAQRYHRLLSARIGLLERHLQAASALPLTLNHGDLRPPNGARDAQGRCWLMDWDDAMVGPAGLSLHGLFSGCTVPTVLLSGSAAAQAAASSPQGLRIRSYVDQLVQQGYADEATLTRALPAAMCAGVMQFVLNFGQFPGEATKEGVRTTLSNRMSDLLDLCDRLATQDAETTLRFADHYEAHGEDRRAQGLLQDHVLRHPEDARNLARLGHLLRRRGLLEQAVFMLESGLEQHPEHAGLLASLGTARLAQLQEDAACRDLTRALELDPSLESAHADLVRAQAVQAIRAHAALPENLPRIDFTPEEQAQGQMHPEKRALAAELFNTYGAIQIDHAFPVELVERMQRTFMTRYASYLREARHADALRLGDKRYMVTLDMGDPFGDPAVIGSPWVLPVIRSILGDDCVLGAYTSAVSLPGAQDQRLHKDHPALFPDSPWHFELPCFAAQIILPLVPLNELTGTTRFFKGTHRSPTEGAEELPAQDSVVPLGSCLLTDYRCAHRGLSNRSDMVRPILTMIYNRPWFRDFKNYQRQPPLRMTEADHDALPASLQPLVTWWRDELRVIRAEVDAQAATTGWKQTRLDDEAPAHEAEGLHPRAAEADAPRTV